MKATSFSSSRPGHQSVIAIFCHDLDKGGDPFSNDYYWDAYQDLLLTLESYGAKGYLVTDNKSYLGNGIFSVGYTVTEKTTLDKLIATVNIHADVVIDRADFAGTDVLVINDPYVHNIATNKVEMYRNFPEFQPFSVICETKDQVNRAFTDIPGKMIVVKEPESYGGFHVYIGEKQEIAAGLPEIYPLVVQEFLDTSIGIPGRLTGVHDIRITICGGEIIGYNARLAKPGTYHSNVAQGGKLQYFDVKDTPQEVVKAVHAIDAQFEQYPRFYSADFVNTPKGWKMLELNALLAFSSFSRGVEAENIVRNFAKYLLLIAQEANTNKKLATAGA